MANDTSGEPAPADHKRFYTSFVGTLKWSIIALAVLLILLAVFLVR